MTTLKIDHAPRSVRILGTLSIAALLALTAACSGGGGGAQSPTAPQSGPVMELSTSQGTFTVFTNGHPFDPDAVGAAVDRGYAKARRQIGGTADALRFDGYTLVVMPSSWDLNGQHVRDLREIRMRAGIERVVSHELQHLFAWELGRHRDCRVLQDHPNGYDLHCDRL